MKKLISFCAVFIILCSVLTLHTKVSASVSVSAQSAIVICLDSREVIFEKNAYQKLPMASTTKIMTSLILAEQPDLSKTVKVTSEMVAVEGTSMGLLAGDTVSYRDLLYGMLLASGNDAANTTAIAVGGSIAGFADLMNKKAKELGLKNTSFVTPSGLDDENHYTTAYDLALLASAALENNIFKTVCSSKSATLYYGNPPYKRTLTNHNKLLNSYDGLIGVKTGFTKRSGRCLVTAAERDGKRVVAVTLNAPDDWNDHTAMLDYGLSETESVTYKNDDLNDTIPIISGDCDLVSTKTENVQFCLSKSSVSKIKQKVVKPKFLYATVAAGEKVGEIEYYLDNRLIKTADIYVLADVNEYNPKISFNKRFWSFLKAIWNLV